MSKESKLESLIIKHKTLDKDIKRGYSNYINDEHLKKMKYEKLNIKQQIEKLKNET